MRRLLFAGLAVAVGVAATSALAADDPIASRKKLMDANGAAVGVLVAMVKGEMPFSDKAADAAIKTLDAVAYSYGDFFPAGSDQGDTKASPKIWEDMAGFKKQLANFQQVADQTLQAKPASVDDIKTAMGAIGGACKSCHESYKLN